MREGSLEEVIEALKIPSISVASQFERILDLSAGSSLINSFFDLADAFTTLSNGI